MSPRANGDVVVAEWSGRNDVGTFESDLAELSRAIDPPQLGVLGINLLLRLRAADPPAVDVLLRAVGEGSLEERLMAAKLLPYFDDARIAPALLEVAMRASEAALVTEASRSLTFMPGDLARPSLAQLARNPNGLVSFCNALYGLCRLGEEEGIGLARSYIASESNPGSFRVALAANVATIHHPALWPLIDTIRETFPKVRHVMRLVVLYYRSMKTQGSVEQLRAIASDSQIDRDSRALATSSLVN